LAKLLLQRDGFAAALKRSAELESDKPILRQDFLLGALTFADVMPIEQDGAGCGIWLR
jgi:hypothetical protein